MRRGLLLLSAAFVVGMAAQSWAGVVAYAAGDIAQCHGDPQKSAAARTAQMIPPDAVVFVVGDTAYPFADRATLESCYAPTWGRFLVHTYAVPGNHDYIQGSARDFLDYFGARTPSAFAYQEELAAWERDGIRVVRTVSRPHGGTWTGLTGYVQAHLPHARLEDTVAFLCGQDAMIRGVADVLTSRGMPGDAVFTNV